MGLAASSYGCGQAHSCRTIYGHPGRDYDLAPDGPRGNQAIELCVVEGMMVEAVGVGVGVAVGVGVGAWVGGWFVTVIMIGAMLPGDSR